MPVLAQSFLITSGNVASYPVEAPWLNQAHRSIPIPISRTFSDSSFTPLFVCSEVMYTWLAISHPLEKNSIHGPKLPPPAHASSCKINSSFGIPRPIESQE